MVLQGGDIYITGDDLKTFIYAARSCDINVKADTIEIASPTSALWREFISGRKEWSIDISHLVTTVAGMVPKVGSTAVVRVCVNPQVGLPIYNVVSNVTVQSSSAPHPTGIVWDSVRKVFLAYYNSKYYQSWPNREEYEQYGTYRYGSQSYTVVNGTLVVNQLRGTCIVQSVKLTATKGNLAQGSVKLQGTGELAIVV
jgi:hypothetical protein